MYRHLYDACGTKTLRNIYPIRERALLDADGTHRAMDPKASLELTLPALLGSAGPDPGLSRHLRVGALQGRAADRASTLQPTGSPEISLWSAGQRGVTLPKTERSTGRAPGIAGTGRSELSYLLLNGPWPALPQQLHFARPIMRGDYNFAPRCFDGRRLPKRTSE
jgi:hypothetical protein